MCMISSDVHAAHEVGYMETGTCLALYCVSLIQVATRCMEVYEFCVHRAEVQG